MRPAGEVHLAILQAAHDIRREYAASGRGATLSEMVQRSCVGLQVARNLVPKLKSRGRLEIVGTRRVAGRNRPVAEYAPRTLSVEDVGGAPDGTQSGPGWVDLGNCLQSWAR